MDDQLIGGALDNYRVLSRLGEGKAGVVYMVTPLKDTAFASPGMPLALKLYKPEILKEPDQLRRIENEAKVGSQLSHPNLVRIYDYKIDMNRREIHQAYLVMEYVDGITLHSWLSMFHPISDPLLLRILTQLAEAVSCLHTNGVEQHRDIKPANILISSDFQAKLADFGVAKIDDARPGVHTPSDKFLGTIRNASPELLMGKLVDHRTDLYSLGTVLYALLHGEEIFSETTQFAQLIEKKQHSEPVFDKAMKAAPSAQVSLG